MEIRGGAGGDEANIFAGDLFRMYSRYAEKMNWRVELMSSSAAETGGFREIIFNITHENVYNIKIGERCPSSATGTGNRNSRAHTYSTATVAAYLKRKK